MPFLLPSLCMSSHDDVHDSKKNEKGKQRSAAWTPKIGQRIETNVNGQKEYGIVRWLGRLNEYGSKDVVGVEMDNPVGSRNGIFQNKDLFSSAENHACFFPIEGISPAMSPNEDDQLYSTVLKQNNRKVTARIVPPATSTVATSAFRTAYDEDYASTVRDFATVNYYDVDEEDTNLNLIADDLEDDQDLKSPSLSSPPLPSKSSTLPSKSSTHRSKLSSSNRRLSLSPLRIKSPTFDIVNTNLDGNNFEVGSLVQLHIDGEPLYGVIKWVGWRHDQPTIEQAGIELENTLLGAGNGYYDKVFYFDCPDGRGVFAPFNRITRDLRFADENEVISDLQQTSSDSFEKRKVDFGEIESPIVVGRYGPIQIEDLNKIIGRNKGIQGYQNSCYLDATLFAMFTFTSVFDSLLYRSPNRNDIPQYVEVQKVLREEIVNPLRKCDFVRADRVMKLRKLLDNLTSVQGLISEEKDPEELLNSLLCQTLKAPPFLELSSGQTSHTYQLFVERDERRTSPPTVQELFEQSFHTSAVKLKKMPSILILQMPRFGRQFKLYDRIFPTQLLDVTDIIEGSPRRCICCGSLAMHECLACYSEHGNSLDSTAFCQNCLLRVHSHKNRRNHSSTKLKISPEFLDLKNQPRLFMDLFAVLCIETSHYVTFAKCNDGPYDPWCFFDSMADRKGEINGYNIPEVTRAPDVLRCFKEKEAMHLGCLDEKDLPKHVKRLMCDGYMYFYQSTDVMMYQ